MDGSVVFTLKQGEPKLLVNFKQIETTFHGKMTNRVQ